VEKGFKFPLNDNPCDVMKTGRVELVGGKTLKVGA